MLTRSQLHLGILAVAALACGSDDAVEKPLAPSKTEVVPSRPVDAAGGYCKDSPASQQDLAVNENARNAVQGVRTAKLRWADGEVTDLTVELDVTDAKWVNSEPDEDVLQGINIAVRCDAHLSVIADARLSTADLRLQDLSISGIRFASSDGEAFVADTRGFDLSELGDRYTALARPDECVVAIQLSLGISASGSFTGEVLEQVATDACDQFDDYTAIGLQASGTW